MAAPAPIDQSNQPGWYPQIPKAYTGMSDAEKRHFEATIHQRWNAQMGQDTGQDYTDPETHQTLPLRHVGSNQFVVMPNNDKTDVWHPYLVKYPGRTGTGWQPLNLEGANEYQDMANTLNKTGINPKGGALPDLNPNSTKLGDLKELYTLDQQRKRMQEGGDGHSAQLQLNSAIAVKRQLDDARDLITSGKLNQDDLNFLKQHAADWQSFSGQAKVPGIAPEKLALLRQFKGDVDAAMADGANVPGFRAGSNIASAVSEGLGKMIPEGGLGTLISGGLNAAAGVAKGWTEGKFDVNDIAANLGRADNTLTQGIIKQVHNDTNPTTGNIPYSQEDRDVVSGFQDEMKRQERTDGKPGGIGYKESAWGLSPNLFELGTTKGSQVGQEALEAGKTATSTGDKTGAAAVGQEALDAAKTATGKDQTATDQGDQNLGVSLKGSLFGDKDEPNRVEIHIPWLNNQPTPTPTPTPTQTPAATAPDAQEQARQKLAALQSGGPLVPSQAAQESASQLFEKTAKKIGRFLTKPVSSPLTPPGPSEDTAGQVSGGPSESGEAFSGVRKAPVASSSDAPNVPRLNNQDHVDALPAGSPFYWSNHPNPYVKVGEPDEQNVWQQ
jgi:hypothetical protein